MVEDKEKEEFKEKVKEALLDLFKSNSITLELHAADGYISAEIKMDGETIAQDLLSVSSLRWEMERNYD